MLKTYHNAPDVLILDLLQPVHDFFHETRRLAESECYIDDVIEQILVFICDCKYVQRGMAFEHMRQNILAAYDAMDIQKDGVIAGDAIVQLGRAMAEQFLICGAYTNEGLLPYELGPHWVDGFTPTFVKIDQSELYRER